MGGYYLGDVDDPFADRGFVVRLGPGHRVWIGHGAGLGPCFDLGLRPGAGLRAGAGLGPRLGLGLGVWLGFSSRLTPCFTFGLGPRQCSVVTLSFDGPRNICRLNLGTMVSMRLKILDRTCLQLIYTIALAKKQSLTGSFALAGRNRCITSATFVPMGILPCRQCLRQVWKMLRPARRRLPTSCLLGPTLRVVPHLLMWCLALLTHLWTRLTSWHPPSTLGA